MPRFNGTGPVWGGGPGAGYSVGPCGLGLNRGMGGGYGFRRWTKQDQRSALEEEVEILKEELKATQEELKALKDQK